jgi:hypothetical protein
LSFACCWRRWTSRNARDAFPERARGREEESKNKREKNHVCPRERDSGTTQRMERDSDGNSATHTVNRTTFHIIAATAQHSSPPRPPLDLPRLAGVRGAPLLVEAAEAARVDVDVLARAAVDDDWLRRAAAASGYNSARGDKRKREHVATSKHDRQEQLARLR